LIVGEGVNVVIIGLVVVHPAHVNPDIQHPKLFFDAGQGKLRIQEMNPEEGTDAKISPPLRTMDVKIAMLLNLFLEPLGEIFKLHFYLASYSISLDHFIKKLLPCQILLASS
jgi:hypothetical protein